uniref:Uncharacterized protein n=1 Tax=Caenorhabditis tropicalis TaxID=1561998 RepID=A0A1I7TP87_9PELO
MENSLSPVIKKEELTNEELVEEAIKQGLQPNKRLDDSLKRVSLNLRNAKQTSENLLITTIECTYSNGKSPPNFESNPKFYSSDTIILFINSSFFTIFLIIFIKMFS